MWGCRGMGIPGLWGAQYQGARRVGCHSAMVPQCQLLGCQRHRVLVGQHA